MLTRRRPVRRHNPNAISPAPFVGMILMAAAFFLYAASGLIAPWWAVVLLLLVWLALLVLSFAWWSTHPRRLPWLAGGAMLFWFLALNAGAVFLDWSA